jgi:alpha-beta hydrolase superfamily lysophospholipase
VDGTLAQGTRGALGYWPDPADDPGMALRTEPVVAVAGDGGISRGVLWLPSEGTPDTVVVLSHPRGDFSVHYACPLLAAAGYAVCGFATRYVNNDTDCLHEKAVEDVWAMVGLMRQRFDRVVLLGNSGGGSLMAMAAAMAAGRGDSPAPLGDAFVALAAHPGEGVFLLQVIDPSVTDEDDPASRDPALDMYEPANGYRPWPEPCSYDPGWLARYRAAQRDRVARVDARARAAIARQQDALKEMHAAEKGTAAWLDARRRARATEYLVTYRTLADPAYLDLSIDPDDRPLGTVFAFPDPFAANVGVGLARVMTPRGWLSTWSGLSSDAEVARNLPKVDVPTLVVHPTGDTEIRRHQARAIFEASGSDDATLVEIEGAEHYLQGRRVEAIGHVVDWLRQRDL